MKRLGEIKKEKGKRGGGGGGGCCGRDHFVSIQRQEKSCSEHSSELEFYKMR